MIAAQAACLSYGALDLLSVPGLLTGERIALGLVTVGFALPLGLLIGLGEVLVSRALVRHPVLGRMCTTPRVVPAALIALIAGAVTAWFLSYALEEFHRLDLIVLATTLVAFAAMCGAGLIISAVMMRAPRAGPPVRGIWPRVSFAVLMLVLVAAVRAVLIRTDEAGDEILGLLHARNQLIALAVWALCRVPLRLLSRRIARVHLALSALACLLIFVPVGEHAHDRLDQRYAALGFLYGALDPLLDVDGDGTSLTVMDCAPFDEHRSPWAVEIPDNGIDEDCRYGDLRSLPNAPAQVGPGVSAVVLATVSGLFLDEDGQLPHSMPRIRKLASQGLRFTRPIGLTGTFELAAPPLLSGQLPPAMKQGIGGFAPGDPTLPNLVEAMGGRAYWILTSQEEIKDYTPVFHKNRTRVYRKQHMRATKAAGDYRKRVGTGRPCFIWVHMDGKGETPWAVIDQSLQALADLRDEQTAVLLAGVDFLWETPRRDDKAPPPGGPLLLWAPGMQGTVSDPVGLLDIYATVVELLGLEDRLQQHPLSSALLGTSLRAADALSQRPGAVGARLQRILRVYARGRQGVAMLVDPVQEVIPVGEAADAGEVAKLGRYLEQIMGWQRSRRNRLIQRQLALAPPEDTEAVAEFGHGFQLIGCQAEEDPPGHALVTMFMANGHLLRPDDLLSIGLRPKQGITFWRGVPWGGALPFGRRWRRRGITAQQVVFDLRVVGSKRFPVWVDVFRDEKPISATRGGWFGDRRARICDVAL